MKELDVFHFDTDRKNFDDCSQSNGIQYWYARDFMEYLGYNNWNSFVGVINRAIAACASSNIEILGNFEPIEREIDGSLLRDYKLSKFACYLVAMNGDPKKEQVAKAQIYFVTVAETLKHYLKESEDIERILIRDEVSERERSIAGVAHAHGVTTYSYFQNAGYRGMYNRNLSSLKKYKGLDNLRRTLLDYMGKEELAANLFRLTQTEAKIKNDNVRGQSRLETVAETVGKQVRNAMMEISGTRPEDLPLSDDIQVVKKSLKSTQQKLLSKGKTNTNASTPSQLPPDASSGELQE